MDLLAGLLEGPRARGAFMIRACFEAPWAVRIAGEAPLTVMIMVEGEAWILPAGDGPARRLRPGDLAIARGPDPYVCCDDPATAPRAEIGPGQVCRPLGPAHAGRYRDLGVRTWGESRDGAAQLLIGAYQMRGELTARLSSAFKRVHGVGPQEYRP